MRNEREASSLTMQLELEDQAHDLLAASSVPGMEIAAQRLRLTALDVRRRLMNPSLVQPAPTVVDPVLRRTELADLAVDVVTATDYLLSLLASPSSTSAHLVLACNPASYRTEISANDDVHQLLIRRRLDARSAAVRLGMRLGADLCSDIANTY